MNPSSETSFKFEISHDLFLYLSIYYMIVLDLVNSAIWNTVMIFNLKIRHDL